MSQSILKIPREEYDLRIASVQKSMREKGIDLLVTHACGCESATVRYLTDFWAVFDFVGVLVPAEGKPILLTGGPESFDFAVQFARIDDVRVHPLYVETSAPEWDKPVNPWNFRMILDELRARMPIKTIGIATSTRCPTWSTPTSRPARTARPSCPRRTSSWTCAPSRAKMKFASSGGLPHHRGGRPVRGGCRPARHAGVELEALWRGKIYEMGARAPDIRCGSRRGPAPIRASASPPIGRWRWIPWCSCRWAPSTAATAATSAAR
jgi:hypothetical protein